MNLFVHVFGVVSTLTAAGCWLRASLLEVPDNVNTIVRELQHIGRWNAWAAMATVVAAACGAYGFATGAF